MSSPGPLRPLLVLALDGATFHVIEPMLADGRLPNLARWMARGIHHPLPSTVPPVTFPAWSSFMTGTGPGEHGIFDFTQKVPGEYRIRFVNATDRTGADIFSRVNDAGGRILVLGMPATFPPEPRDGLLVCGFDAPVSAGTDARSASDPELYERVAGKVGPWMRPDLDEGARADDFHERAVATLLARIERKTAFALESLKQLRAEGGGPELAMVVFAESDTAGHHYWRDHDPASPRHDAAAGDNRGSALERVYEALDVACGDLRAAFGEDAACFVVSDHGMGGASDRIVHLNAYLAERGLLVRKGNRAPGLDTAARGLRDLALRLLPARIAQLVFRAARGTAARLESAARFGGHDWGQTRAFSEEANTQPGVWINLMGREARGCVAPEDYERVRDETIDALLDWKDPEGNPIVARARRREDVYTGPFVERAPDVVVELATVHGYGLSLVPTPWERIAEGHLSVRTLTPDEYAGGRGRGMNGTHRPNGIFIADGLDDGEVRDAAPSDDVDTRNALPFHLEEVAHAIAAVMGLPPTAADGGARSPDDAARSDYSSDEDAMVAERLRTLGYLE